MSESTGFGSYVLSYATLFRVEVTAEVTQVKITVTSQVRKLRDKFCEVTSQVRPRSYARTPLFRRGPRNFGGPRKIGDTAPSPHLLIFKDHA